MVKLTKTPQSIVNMSIYIIYIYQNFSAFPVSRLYWEPLHLSQETSLMNTTFVLLSNVHHAFIFTAPSLLVCTNEFLSGPFKWTDYYILTPLINTFHNIWFLIFVPFCPLLSLFVPFCPPFHVPFTCKKQKGTGQKGTKRDVRPPL